MYRDMLGHWSQLGQFRKLPKLFLHSTMNTWVTCPICRGVGQNSIIHESGQVTLQLCPHCKGTKRYFNHDNRN